MDALLQRIQGHDPEERIRALGEVATFVGHNPDGWDAEAVVHALTDCLKDINVRICAYALDALVAVVAVIQDSPEDMGVATGAILAHLPAPLSSNRPGVRDRAQSLALVLMEATSTAAVLKQLEPMTQARNPRSRAYVCALAKRACGHFAGDERLELATALLASRLLGDSISGVRTAALDALAEAAASAQGASEDPEDAVEALVESMVEAGATTAGITALRRRLAGEAVRDPEGGSGGGGGGGGRGRAAPAASRDGRVGDAGGENDADEDEGDASDDEDDEDEEEVCGPGGPPFAPGSLSGIHSCAEWYPGITGFSELLDSVEPVTWSSASDLDRCIHATVSVIATGDADWRKRMAAISTVRGLIKAGVARTPDFASRVPLFVDPLMTQAADLRSILVKQACCALAELSAATCEGMQAVAGRVTQGLLQLTPVTIAVIATSARDALYTVLHNTRRGYSRALPKLCSAARSKSAQIRARTAECLAIACRGWSAAAFSRHAELVVDTVVALTTDADAEARSTARLAWWSLVQLFPDLCDDRRASMDTTNLRRLDAAHRDAVDATIAAVDLRKDPVRGADGRVKTPFSTARGATTSPEQFRALLAAAGDPSSRIKPRHAALVQLAKLTMSSSAGELWSSFAEEVGQTLVEAAGTFAPHGHAGSATEETSASALATLRRVARYQSEAVFSSHRGIGRRVLFGLLMQATRAGERRDVAHNIARTLEEVSAQLPPLESMEVGISVIAQLARMSAGTGLLAVGPSAVQGITAALRLITALIPRLSSPVLRSALEAGRATGKDVDGAREDAELRLLPLLCMTVSSSSSELRKNATVCLAAVLGRIGEASFAAIVEPELSAAQRDLVRIYARLHVQREERR